MKRYIISSIVAVSVIACSNGQPQSASSFDGKLALDFAKAHLEFGPRVPGTTGWSQAADHMVAELEKTADTVFEQRWTHQLANGDSIPQRNIIAQFNPDKKDRILYVVHWDTRPIADNELDSAERAKPIIGANDGASGVALLLALSDALSKSRPNVGVDLLFVDGEDYGNFTTETDVLIGSTYFAKNPPWENYKPLFGVVWDMIGGKDLKVYKEQNSMAGAPEVVSRVWNVAADKGLSDVFVPQTGYAVLDDHIPLLQAGLRVINVIDLDFPHHHTHRDTFDKLSAESLRKIGTVALALLQSH